MNFIEFLTGKTLTEITEGNVQADIQGVQTKLGDVVKPPKPSKKTKRKKDKDPSPLDKTGKKLIDGQDSEDLEESDLEFELPQNDFDEFSELNPETQEELDELTQEEFLFWLGQMFYKSSPEFTDRATTTLHSEFYDTEPVQDEYEAFTLSDLLYLVLELLDEGLDYDDILDLIEFDDVWSPLSDIEQNFIQDVVQDLYEDSDELSEAIKPRFTSKQHNKKRRKFMQKSKAQLNREKVKRRQMNRLNKQKRKQYYRKNKNKIKLYSKQYRKAVKKGTHRVKVRRNA